jgi:hypothetical protein
MMASSSSLGGTILADLRLMKRSITRARPTTEHAIRGQIGQPAACMMENKSELQAKTGGWAMWNYGAVRNACMARFVGAQLCTATVDNFVDKHATPRRRPAPTRRFNRSITKQAAQMLMNSPVRAVASAMMLGDSMLASAGALCERSELGLCHG